MTILLACSPPIAAKLHRELAALGVPPDLALGADGHDTVVAEVGARWALVERGFEAPPGTIAVLFDPIDYLEAARMIAAAISEQSSAPHRLTGQDLTAASEGTLSMISARDVLYFEAAGDIIVARTEGAAFRVRGTLAHYEAAWASRGFQRINKSQIVNLLQVKEIVPWFNSRYVLRLTGNRELEVSKVYAKRLRGALNL